MNGDRVSGVALFVLAAGVGLAALELPFGSLPAPDSGFFPLTLAAALLGLAGVIVAQTFSADAPAAPLPSRQGVPRVLLAVAALVAYALVLDRLGYLAATLAVMILLLRGLERRGWLTTLLVSIPAVLASWGLFRWLGVPLPQGIVPL